MAIKKGQYIKFECNYPRSKKVNGVFEGLVTEVGCLEVDLHISKLILVLS